MTDSRASNTGGMDFNDAFENVSFCLRIEQPSRLSRPQ